MQRDTDFSAVSNKSNMLDLHIYFPVFKKAKQNNKETKKKRKIKYTNKQNKKQTHTHTHANKKKQKQNIITNNKTKEKSV